LPMVMSLVVVVTTLAFLYYQRAREESWRVHRLFYNDLLTKAAEGLAESAFAWFQANPSNPIILGVLNNQTLPIVNLKGILPAEIEFAKRNVGVNSFKLSLICVEKYMSGKNGINGFPEVFSSENDGYFFPDNREVYGLLKVEVEVFAEFRKFSRKYEALRELRCISLLPSFFGKFTLFVQNKKPLLNGDPNQMKVRIGTNLNDFAGHACYLAPINNPLVLVHSPMEMDRIVGRDELVDENSVAPTWKDPEQFRLDNRGWTFLGPVDANSAVSSYANYPFRLWGLNTVNGRVNAARTKSQVGATYFAQGFMMTTYSELFYHTSMPTLNSKGIPPSPTIFENPPFSEDPDGIPFRGTIMTLSRGGYSSTYNLRPDFMEIPRVFLNYFSPTRNPKCSKEPVDPSLLHIFGDLYPLPGQESSKICDQRSPTLVFGNVTIRLLQRSWMRQMGEIIHQWIVNNELDIVSRIRDLAGHERGKNHPIPYFPFKNSSPDSAYTVPFNEFSNEIEWKQNSEIFRTNRHYAAVNYFITDIIGQGKMFENLMSKIIQIIPMHIVEIILQNNMAEETAPSGWVPKPKYLKNIPSIIQPLEPDGSFNTAMTANTFYFKKGSPLFLKAIRFFFATKLAKKLPGATCLRFGHFLIPRHI